MPLQTSAALSDPDEDLEKTKDWYVDVLGIGSAASGFQVSGVLALILAATTCCTSPRAAPKSRKTA